MAPARLSVCFLLSFLGTVFLLQWNQAAAYPMSVWLTLALGALAGLYGCIVPVTRNVGGCVAACAIGMLLAFSAVSRTTRVETALSVERYAVERVVSVRGRIAAEPERRPLFTRYAIAAAALETATGALLPVEGKVLATDRSGWPRYRYGDAVIVRGNLLRPGGIKGFRYDLYLARYEITAIMPRATVAAGGGTAPASILRTLYDWKDAFEARLAVLYPEPQSSLLAGLITGSRRGIPEDLQQDFADVGLSHLVAISGTNVTMVIAALGTLLFWLPLRWRYIPSVCLVLLFALFTGGSASVMRAAIMGVLGLTAVRLGRSQSLRLSILWTLCAMLVWNPKQLWYDAGFQLSFLALLGITEIAPLVERWFTWLPERFGLRETLRLTVAAQITTVPWMAMLFGRLSLIAPIANVLAPPAVPAATFFGLGSAAVSPVLPFIAKLISIPGSIALQWIILWTRALARLPFAAVGFQVGPKTVTVCYATLIIWAVARNLPPGFLTTRRAAASSTSGPTAPSPPGSA